MAVRLINKEAQQLYQVYQQTFLAIFIDKHFYMVDLNSLKVIKELLVDFIPQGVTVSSQRLYIFDKKQICEYDGIKFNKVYDARDVGSIEQMFIQQDQIYVNFSNEQLAKLNRIRETNNLSKDMSINLYNVISCYKFENKLFTLCNKDEIQFYDIFLDQKLVKENIQINGKQPKIIDIKQSRIDQQKIIYSIIIQDEHQVILLNAIYDNEDKTIKTEEPIKKDSVEQILVTQISNIQFNIGNQNDISYIQNCNDSIFQDAGDLKMQVLMLNCSKSELAQANINIITQYTIKQLYLSSADTENIDETMSLVKIIQILKDQVLNDKYIKNENQCMTIQQLNQNIVQEQFQEKQDTLQQIVIAAYLFNNSVYPLFRKAVKLIELQITQQQETYIISNVRAIAKQCRDIIRQSSQILMTTINNQNIYSNYDINVQSYEIRLCKMLISVVQNSIEILQILSDNQNILEQESLHYILQGKIYISVTKILSVMQKEDSIKDDQFQQKLEKSMVFNGKVDEFNPLYTDSFGYFNTGYENQELTIVQSDQSQIDNYYQINDIKNSAIYQLYQVIHQLDFVQYQYQSYQEIQLTDFITLLTSFLQQQYQNPISLDQLKTQNEKQRLIFDILRIIFLYKQLSQQKTSDQVYQIALSLSSEQNEARKFYFAAQLLYQIDCGSYQKQNQSTEQFFQQNYFDKDAQLLMIKYIGQKILNDSNILFNNITQQQEFEQILMMLQDSIDTIKFVPDFIVRLTHLAAIKGKYDLALGLAQYCFCKQSEYDELIEFQQYQNGDQDYTKYYPHHECLSAYENTIRILLLKACRDFDVQAAMQTINCLNSFMSHKSPYCVINQRIAIIQNQILLNQIDFAQVNGIHNQGNIKQILQLLMLHKQPNQEQKRLLIKYSLQNNNVQLGFIIAFLYQYDQLLALKLIKFIDRNNIQLTEKQQETKQYIFGLIQNHYKFLDIQGIEDNFEQLLQFRWLTENMKVKIMNPLAMSLCHTVVNDDQSQQQLIQQAMKILDESRLDVDNQDAIYKEIIQSTVGYQQQPQQQVQILQENNQVQEQQLKQQQQPLFRPTRAQLLRERYAKAKLLQIKQQEEKEAKLNNNYQFKSIQQNQKVNSFTTNAFNNNTRNQFNNNGFNNYNNTYNTYNNAFNNNNNRLNNNYQQPQSFMSNKMVQNNQQDTYDLYKDVPSQYQTAKFAPSTQQFGQQKVQFNQVMQQNKPQNRTTDVKYNTGRYQFTTGSEPTNKHVQIKNEINPTNSVIKNEQFQQQTLQFQQPQQQLSNPFASNNQPQKQFNNQFQPNNPFSQSKQQLQIQQISNDNQMMNDYQQMPQQEKRGGLRTNLMTSPMNGNQQQNTRRGGVSFVV